MRKTLSQNLSEHAIITADGEDCRFEIVLEFHQSILQFPPDPSDEHLKRGVGGDEV